MSLGQGGTDIAEPADASNAASLVGVVASRPLLELSDSGTSSPQIVVSGPTQALVSDLNGQVRVGDKVTAAPIDGIGMKATSSTEIVGTAAANLSSVTTVTRTVTSRDGKRVTFKVGLLPLTVGVAYYTAPTQNSDHLASLVPPALQAAANSLAGQPVSALRVLMGTLALVFGFLVVAMMSVVAVQSGISSIGRNPLAELAIRRGFIDVVIAAAGVLVVTACIVYLVLVV